MPDYRQLEPGAIAADASFQRWQLLGDPIDGAFWEEWLRQHPDQGERIEQAAELLKVVRGTYEQRLAEFVPLSDEEIRAGMHRLRASIREPGVRRVRWLRLTPVRYGIAAGLLALLVGFGWNTFGPTDRKPADLYGESVAHAEGPLVEIATTNQSRRVDLPDRSTVTLYPNSRMSYDRSFRGRSRDVYLSGKAQFDVVRNPAKPFYVFANGLTTKVLGTRFTVRADAGTQHVNVSVRSGKVAVFAPNRATPTEPDPERAVKSVVLTPNQQLTFLPVETRFVRSVVAQPVRLEPPAQQPSVRFRRAPIADVFAALERLYGIPITFDADQMRHCYLTASLTDEPLFGQLDLICHTINARYEQIDGAIIVHSSGCEYSPDLNAYAKPLR